MKRAMLGAIWASLIATAPCAAECDTRSRDMMRQIGQGLILGSPEQRVKGVQMLIEAEQPLPCELEIAERRRLLDVIDKADVDDATRARAKIAVELGATTEQLLEVLGFYRKSQKAPARP